MPKEEETVRRLARKRSAQLSLRQRVRQISYWSKKMRHLLGDVETEQVDEGGVARQIETSAFRGILYDAEEEADERKSHSEAARKSLVAREDRDEKMVDGNF